MHYTVGKIVPDFFYAPLALGKILSRGAQIDLPLLSQ